MVDHHVLYLLLLWSTHNLRVLNERGAILYEVTHRLAPPHSTEDINVAQFISGLKSWHAPFDIANSTDWQNQSIICTSPLS